MREQLFRGRLAIGFVISNLLWGLAGAVMILLGGHPLESPDGQPYVLANHTVLTEVSHAAWVSAHVCMVLMITGWLMMFASMVALFLRKVKYDDRDPGTNHAVLCGASMVVSLILCLLATACAPTHG